MAKPRKVSVVDGYTALKVAQHAHQTPKRSAAPKPSRAAAGTGNQPADLQKLGAQVGRTIVPTKHVIECYECGYRFQLHGKAATTNCSKCRAVLDLTDHTIDTRWTRSFKTCGTIRIAATGVLEAGDLVAENLILEGAIEAGTVRVLRTLELRPGARFPEANITAPDLVIAPGATITLINPAKYHDVDIAGTLRATLHATGLITIRAGGLLHGEIDGSHLVVEEGGGLQGTLRIANDTAKPPAAQG